MHLSRYPSFNCSITALFYRLPIIVRSWSITLYHTNVPYLAGPPIVWLVVKTIEHSSFHVMYPLLRGWS